MLLQAWIIHFRLCLLYQKSVYQKIIYSTISADKQGEFAFFGRERQKYPKVDIGNFFKIVPFFSMEFNKECMLFHRSHTLKVAIQITHSSNCLYIQHYYEKYQYQPYHQLQQSTGHKAQMLLQAWIIHFRLCLLYQKSVYQKIIYSTISADKQGEFAFFGRERQKYPKVDIGKIFKIVPFFSMEFNKECMLFHRSHTLKVAK